MNTGVSVFYCFSERLPDFEAEMVNNFVNLYSGHTGPFLVRVRSSIALDLLAPRLNARQTAEIKPVTALYRRRDKRIPSVLCVIDTADKS